MFTPQFEPQRKVQEPWEASKNQIQRAQHEAAFHGLSRHMIRPSPRIDAHNTYPSHSCSFFDGTPSLPTIESRGDGSSGINGSWNEPAIELLLLGPIHAFKPTTMSSGSHRRITIPMRYVLSTTSPDHSAPPDHAGLHFVTSLIENGAVGLQRLLEVQNEGWNDTKIEKHFINQRQTADTASTELSVLWFRRMKNLLSEIDHNLHFIPIEGTMDFLDLGCCPGGFSSYILDKNIDAKGVGVSLPPAEGGHEFLLEEHHNQRYELYLVNLTYLQLGPSPIHNEQLHDIPSHIEERYFDLVLLDGHQLRTQTSALPWDSDRLLISQLIIALQSVKEGGTIVIKLPLPHKVVTARILLMLNSISLQLCRWKPKSMHANRGTFYAVARGVGVTQDARTQIDFLLRHLKDLWAKVTFGGEEGKGRFLVVEDMDFIFAIDDVIAHHLDWLIRFGTPLWKVQEVALRKLCAKKSPVSRSQ